MPLPHAGVVVVDTIDVAPPPLAISSDARLASLLKEAKAYRQKLHSILEQGDVRPNASHVEFARKELRNTYLKLLFHFTFASRTRLTEQTIWVETTHPIVHLYRSQLSAIEAKLRKRQERNGDDDSANRRAGDKQAAQHASHLAQNHAKLNSAFRAFLASEELFWRDVAGRITILYSAKGIVPNLRSLDIVSEAGQIVNGGTSGVERIVGLEPLSAEAKAEATLASSVDRVTEIVHKALLYCGDIARYTEQYRDDQQDEHEDPARLDNQQDRGVRGRGRGRGRGGTRGGRPSAFGVAPNKPRDFSRAAAFYEQARHLLPSNGNPWNQLAVLAAYRGDTFSFVYHCYRGLCVSEPFEKAKSNMEKSLRKKLDLWLEEGNLARFTNDSADDDSTGTRSSSTVVLLDLSTLHAALLHHNQDILFSRFPAFCIDSIRVLLRRKALQTDVVVRITLTTIAALWLHRLWRGTSAANKLSGAASSIVVEHSILLHLCGLAQAMLDIGANEVVEAMADDGDEPGNVTQTGSRAKDQRISPTLRRMLPALRLLSKWMKAHIGYVQKSRRQVQAQSMSSEDPDSTTSAASVLAYEQMAAGVDRMWSSYANFVNVIRYAFPFEGLPTLGSATLGQSGMSGIDFEEDRDVRGFIPLRKGAMVEIRSLDDIVPNPIISPEDEHLIRIADIIIDAKVVAETQSSPIHFIDEKNTFEFVRSIDSQSQDRVATAAPTTQQVRLDDDNKGDVDDLYDASESSEDAVDLAMRAVDERRRALAEGNVNGHSGDASIKEGVYPKEEEDIDDEDDDEIILIPSSRNSVQKGDRKSAKDDVAALQPEQINAQHLLLQVINGSPQSANAPAQRVSSSTAPKPLGPIGSPIARNTPSPQSTGQSSAVWPTDSHLGGMAHRADIWAPPPPAQLTGQSNQLNYSQVPSVGWSNVPAPPSNLRDWPRSTSRDNPW